MRERPIIFSGESVRAIQAGRKTMTRRVIRPQPPLSAPTTIGFDPAEMGFWDEDGHSYRSPYGIPGDRLWVRETWAHFIDVREFDRNNIVYRANNPTDRAQRWRSPIFMPRWASRIDLEITNVRVERLQDISDGSIEAEGIHAGNISWTGDADEMLGLMRQEFINLWNSCNARRGYPFSNNPWVWVIEFRRIRP